jgi:hypothetical protein
VRIIGVTGEQIEMDVYDIEPEQIERNSEGLIKIISLAEGITTTEVTKLSCSEKIVEVGFNQIPVQPVSGCAKERWMKNSC